MICVLDASAVIAYLSGEPGHDVVANHLNSGKCLIHAVNLCEVIYRLRRQETHEETEETLSEIFSFDIAIRDDLDLPFLQIVADYKVAPGQVSLGDCFGLALAQRVQLPFLTSDRHEVTRVFERGTVAIEFIR